MCKLKLILYIFFSIHFIVYGQDFAPVGATWHYNFPEGFSPNRGYIVTESVKDTIVLGKNAKKLSLTHFTSASSFVNLPSEIIFSDTNKVYLFLYNQFRLLYDFNANQGDTIFVTEPYYLGNNTDTLIPILVDSTKNEMIGGVLKKVQYITSLEPSWYFGSKIIKGIGSDNYLLPIFAAADPAPGPFRCYSDSLLSYQLVNDCEEIITSIKENTTHLNPYPLQTTVYNNLILPDIKGEITIYDIQGRQVFNDKIRPSIPINLKNGVYIVLLTNKEFQHKYKIVKL